MVTSVLFVMATGLLFGLFHRIARWRSWEQGVRDTQRQCLTASAHMVRSLRECAFGTVSAVYAGGVPTSGDLILSAVSSRDDQGLWRETMLEPDDDIRLAFYVQPATAQLVERRVDTGSATPLVTPFTPAQMIAESVLPESRVLGRGIEFFSLIHPVTGVLTDEVTSPLCFQIRISGDESQDSRSLQRTVVFAR